MNLTPTLTPTYGLPEPLLLPTPPKEHSPSPSPSLSYVSSSIFQSSWYTFFSGDLLLQTALLLATSVTSPVQGVGLRDRKQVAGQSDGWSRVRVWKHFGGADCKKKGLRWVRPRAWSPSAQENSGLLAGRGEAPFPTAPDTGYT